MRNVGETPAPRKKPAANIKFVDSGASGFKCFTYNGKLIDIPFIQYEISKIGGGSFGKTGDPIINILSGKFDSLMIGRSKSNTYYFKASVGNVELRFFTTPAETKGDLGKYGERTYKWLDGEITSKTFSLLPMGRLPAWGKDATEQKKFWNSCIRLSRGLIENGLPKTLVLDEPTKELMNDLRQVLKDRFNYKDNDKVKKLETLFDLARQTLAEIK